MQQIPEYLRKITAGEVPPPPIAKLIGFELTDVKRGYAVVELKVNEQYTNPFGGIHGGLICDIADSAMGAAYHSTLAENEICTTLELKTSFLKPAPKGKLRAEANVLKEGRSIGFLECTITDEQGQLIAKATSTLLKQPVEGRE